MNACKLPEYSTDLAAAFEVAQRMRKDGFSFKVWQPSLLPEVPRPDCAVVSFICGTGPCPKHGNELHNHHGAYDVDAETLPLAICRAALVALKAVVPEREPRAE